MATPLDPASDSLDDWDDSDGDAAYVDRPRVRTQILLIRTHLPLIRVVAETTSC